MCSTLKRLLERIDHQYESDFDRPVEHSMLF